MPRGNTSTPPSPDPESPPRPHTSRYAVPGEPRLAAESGTVLVVVMVTAIAMFGLVFAGTLQLTAYKKKAEVVQPLLDGALQWNGVLSGIDNTAYLSRRV